MDQDRKVGWDTYKGFPWCQSTTLLAVLGSPKNCPIFKSLCLFFSNTTAKMF